MININYELVNIDNRYFCFKDKKPIERNECKRCYQYYSKCRYLYKWPRKRFEPGNNLNKYCFNECELGILQEFINKTRRTRRRILVISTKEIMEYLKRKYNLEIDQSLLFQYAKKGLIPKGKKIGQGKSKGVQTFWEDSVKYLPYYIKQLLVYCKLQEISKYKNLVYNFDELEIAEVFPRKEQLEEDPKKFERQKFQNVIVAYACAEAGHEYGLEIRGINNKIFVPIIYAKIEENRIKEIHIKIVDTGELQNEKSLKDKKAYKEIIFSKKGKEIIG